MKKRSTKKTTPSSGDDWYPTDKEFAAFKPIAHVDPKLLAAHKAGTIKKRGRPKLEQKKEVISVRLDPAIIDAMRAQGRGWQMQLNAFLYATYVKGDRTSP